MICDAATEMLFCATMVTKRAKTARPKPISEKKLLDELERKHWPEIEKRLVAARASAASGKVRKWNLDRFLTDLEKRRRAKQAAE